MHPPLASHIIRTNPPALQSCGIQSEVCNAVVAVLPSLPYLHELQLALRRAVAQSTAEALAAACASCTQLSALDLHFPGYTTVAPTVPGWRRLAALAGLRSLHASSGLGWDAAALAAVAAAATALRAVTLTDNAGAQGAKSRYGA